ncbi:MAG: XcbB/CpsF family capsular polysaccharide biosynthesis protein [Arthrobacter sp.]
MSHILYTSLDEPVEEIVKRIVSGNYLYIYLSDPSGIKGDYPLLKAAHKIRRVKRHIVELAKNGFHVYHEVDGISRLVRQDHIPRMWHSVLKGDYESSQDGIIYSLQGPKTGGQASNLVVIFSSIGGDIFGSGLARYFTQNFRSINKHVPGDTAFLRIADIGGVVGSFYLDTVYSPRNTKSIADLIENVRSGYGIERSSVITYGASKGATGALYHALQNDYKCVCVEPIVNDEYYETSFGDTHFTADGVFLETKEETFGRLLEAHENDVMSKSGYGHGRIVVVYSKQSPQASYIENTVGTKITNEILLVNFCHPAISDHPDVSPNSLNLISMYLNMMAYGLPINAGKFAVLCRS